jgi:hypothetical protein
MRERLVRCRTRIEATDRWAAGVVPFDEAIVHVLSTLAEESR